MGGKCSSHSQDGPFLLIDQFYLWELPRNEMLRHILNQATLVLSTLLFEGWVGEVFRGSRTIRTSVLPLSPGIRKAAFFSFARKVICLWAFLALLLAKVTERMCPCNYEKTAHLTNLDENCECSLPCSSRHLRNRKISRIFRQTSARVLWIRKMEQSFAHVP